MLGKRESNPVTQNQPERHKKVKGNSAVERHFSDNYFKLFEVRSKLPAFGVKEQLFGQLRKSDFLIVQGETGSGKTTQIPQFLMNSEFVKSGKMISCTQPRRIAAISVSKRVSEETDTQLGQEVGYAIRFEDKSSSSTVLKYMTDGMLIRELITDRLLSKYSVVILDESHERTLNTDILIPILKDLVERRNGHKAKEEETVAVGPLKLILMSATLEIDRFVKYFDGRAPVLSIPGRQFPVEIVYSKESEPDYIEAAVQRAVDIHLNELPGDVLVFLTGEEEIEFAVYEIEQRLKEQSKQVGPFLVLPLFGSMSIESQQAIFNRTVGTRKIVVATNIAETSITIDGIVYVVDCGLSKQKVYNPRFQFESLLVAPISKGSAKQRAGRAGRTCPGKCYRLYTAKSFEVDLPEFSIAEALRSELSGTILSLFLLGISNLKQFHWVEAPSVETVFKGLETLVNIGAIDADSGNVTLEGTTIGNFPLEPRLAKVLLKAKELAVVEECLDAVAVMTTGNWRIRPQKEAFKVDKIHSRFTDVANCDIMTTHNVFKSFFNAKNKSEFCRENFLNFRVLSGSANVKSQLRHIVFSAKTLLDDNSAFLGLKVSERVKVSFLSGFYQQVGHLMRDGSYNIVLQGHYALIHPSSTIKSKPDFILYLEFVLTSKNYLRMVTQIDPVWLVKLYPQLYNPQKIKLTETKRALERAIKERV